MEAREPAGPTAAARLLCMGVIPKWAGVVLWVTVERVQRLSALQRSTSAAGVALDGKGPQRRPQKRLDGRLEAVAKGG